MTELDHGPLYDPAAEGSTSKAGQTIDDSQARIFPCEECGADLEFNIGVQKMKCPYCGHEKDIELREEDQVAEQDFEAMLQRLHELRMDEVKPRDTSEEAVREIRCESCGGTTAFTGSLTSTECPYCGSPIQLDDVHESPRRVPVDGVLPFLIEHRRAQENLKAWVDSRWFAPNEFRRRGVKGKFNGIYLPFWTFDCLTFTRYSGSRGEHYWVTVGSGDKKRQERRTRWWPASGAFQRFFDDVLVIAVRRVNPTLVQALEPWPLGQVVPFNQQMLAGYLARTYECELEEGFAEARRRIKDALTGDVQRRIGGDEQRIDRMDTRYDAITFKHLLLPVWLMAYRYRDKSYQIIINAATGEVQGERPYSWVKIGLLIVTIVAAVIGIAALQQR